MICQKCNQPIKESVLEGRKLIAQVRSGPETLQGMGRYLTVYTLACDCGERIEHRYENQKVRESLTS
jgi:hypothetical protein